MHGRCRRLITAMECPFCSSTDIQSHAVVRAEGTHHISISHSGSVGGQSAHGYSHGTQYSDLARQCAPPSPPTPLPFVIAFGFSGAIIYGAAFKEFPHIYWQATFTGLAGMVVGWLLFKFFRVQNKEYVANKMHWLKSWFCHGCGQSHTRD